MEHIGIGMGMGWDDMEVGWDSEETQVTYIDSPQIVPFDDIRCICC